MASPANPEPSSKSLPEIVLRAARDIGQVDTAFDAELLLSTVVGGVYAGLLPDRAQGLDAFLDLLREHLRTTDDPNGPLVSAVLDAPTDGPGAPAWAAALGRVRPTGGYAYGDRYGDQTSYLATYEYEDPQLGGPDHVVVVLADHNLGTARDLLIVAPAGPVLEQLRDGVARDADAMTWLAEVPLGTVRKAATAYLRATDLAAETPPADSLTANRWLALARLAVLPDELPVEETPAPPAPAPVNGSAPTDAKATLINEFLDGPEAQMSGLASAAGARRESVSYCLGLVVDFAVSRGGDPLRWSPRAVTTFLTEWIHQHAILDKHDIGVLPEALGAWVTWSGRRVGLPDAAVRQTFAEIGATRAEFTRLCATGERQSPAVRAMAQLVAEGVDLADEAAVDAWLRTYNADHAD